MYRKYLPAIVSALVVIALAVGYYGGILLIVRSEMVELVFVQVIIGATGLAITVGVGWALIARILELKGGQEDDIGKY